MSEKQLKDFHKLKAIIDTAIDGIIIIDGKGIIENINSSVAALFGYDENELLGNNVKLLMPFRHRVNHDQYISRYIETGVAKIIGIGREVEGLKKDGSRFPFRLSVSQFLFEGQIKFTGIIHDLTDIKAVENRLNQLNEELEEKVEERTSELEKAVNRLLTINKQLNSEIEERQKAEEKLMKSEVELKTALNRERELSELKSRFVGMASHEFRTPLSTILSSASLILRYTETVQQEKRLRHVNKIKSAIGNLTSILNEFLSLSRLEEGKVDLDYAPLDMKELFEEIVDDIKGLVKPGQYIEFIEEGKSRPIITDRRILKNALYNLISNAIKYSSADSKIIWKTHYNADDVTIFVIDKGMGIPVDEQKHLFIRFFRASNAVNVQGTGLGLNIVKRYIDLLGGKISFISELDKGSSFIVSLSNKNES